MLNHKKSLYIGEVPIAPKPGGAMLLYRCFDYLELELDKIYIGLPDEHSSIRSEHTYPFNRLRTTRFSTLYTYVNFKFLWLFLFLQLVFKLRRYNTIYTVSHGVTYKLVFNICKIWKKNLVIFHHDLYSKTLNIKQNQESKIEEWFAQSIKKDFVENLFVSPYMKILYNVEGKVLYPTRPKFIEENKNFKNPCSTHNMFYAGSVHSTSNYLAILNVAKYLDQMGGSLHLYSNLSEEDFTTRFSNLPKNIIFNPFVEQDVLREILYKNADSMLVVQNFEESDQTAQMVNFPSKLADYTLVGVPIIILAPQYASSAQWFLQLDEKIGVHIDSYQFDDLKKGLNGFFSSIADHRKFGINAQKIGKKYFSIEAYNSIFKDM